jgi:hypothetical protein
VLPLNKRVRVEQAKVLSFSLGVPLFVLVYLS